MRSQRTLQTIKKNSDANKENSDYLKLFMLEKERTRLRNELIRLNLRNEILNARLKEIDEFYAATLGTKENAASGSADEGEVRQEEKKEWQTMPIKY